MTQKPKIDLYKKNFNKLFNIKKLPKIKQDIINSLTQTSLNRKYGDLVENILERKRREKK